MNIKLQGFEGPNYQSVQVIQLPSPTENPPAPNVLLDINICLNGTRKLAPHWMTIDEAKSMCEFVLSSCRSLEVKFPHSETYTTKL